MKPQSTRKETICVQGMFCSHCEENVSAALNALEGVVSARASLAEGSAEVVYDPGIVSLQEIHSAVNAAGYEVVEKGSGSRAAAVLLVILALYVIASHMGWTRVFSVFPTVGSTVSLGILFVIGALTGVHCIAMCGGINLMQSASSAQRRTGEPVLSNLLYNTGRVISYTLTGALCGGIGMTLQLSGILKGLIPAAAGIFMLIMSLKMLGLGKWFRKVRVSLPFRIRTGAGAASANRSSFVIGLLNGLMPCGPLQSMQLYALSTGSVLMGAASMFFFSLGTVPLMFGFGFAAGKLGRRHRQTMQTVSAVLIFVMGLSMIMNGLSMSGITIFRTGAQTAAVSTVEENVQYLRNEIDYGSYPAFAVKKGIPVEWTLVVPEGKLTGCNGEIIIPSFGLDVKLHEGENLIRFTPETAGVIPYSCWMGMIRSTIEVTD